MKVTKNGEIGKNAYIELDYRDCTLIFQQQQVHGSSSPQIYIHLEDEDERTGGMVVPPGEVTEFLEALEAFASDILFSESQQEAQPAVDEAVPTL